MTEACPDLEFAPLDDVSVAAPVSRPVSKIDGGPSCFDCKFAGCDPDGPYCGHARSFAETMFGRGFNYMRTVGPCGKDGLLFEPKQQELPL